MPRTASYAISNIAANTLTQFTEYGTFGESDADIRRYTSWCYGR
ncbi:MAG: hypothetical protein R2794_04480 [Chitinophagales bacterium]